MAISRRTLLLGHVLPPRIHAELHYLWRLKRVRQWKNPTRFADLIFRKKLADRRRARELSHLVDKLAVRDYVTQRVGPEILIPLVAVYITAEEISPKYLPSAAAIKATHGASMSLLVRDSRAEDWNRVRRIVKGWLRTDYSRVAQEAPYAHVPRRAIVEQMLMTSEGEPPDDYKFYVMNGTVRLFHLDVTRWTSHRQAFFLPDGRKLRVRRGYPPADEVPPLSSRLREMIAIAEELGRGHDFIRVDLFENRGHIYFGELTLYPAAGLSTFQPLEFEEEVGRAWLEGRPISDEWVE